MHPTQTVQYRIKNVRIKNKVIITVQHFVRPWCKIKKDNKYNSRTKFQTMPVGLKEPG